MSPTSRRRPRYAVGCALAAIAATLASPVWADPAPTYAQLLAQLGEAPATLEAGANYDAAEARVRQARVRPNPVLGLDVENAYGSGPYSGLNNADMTLALSQDLELWGRRGTRVAAARANGVDAIAPAFGEPPLESGRQDDFRASITPDGLKRPPRV